MDGSRGTTSSINSSLISSPYQSVFHNKRDHLARKTGVPERDAHTQCTHGATSKAEKQTLNVNILQEHKREENGGKIKGPEPEMTYKSQTVWLFLKGGKKVNNEMHQKAF